MTKPTCAIPDCEGNPPYRRGWCSGHYNNWRRTGSPIPATPLPIRPDLPGERWLPVAGFPGYEVSDQGNVRSMPRKGADGRRLGGRTLRPRPTPTGYLRVGLCLDREVVDRYIHQLVAEAFLGPRPEGMDVAHWDGKPGHNAASNLRYASRSENQLDMRRHGTHLNGRKTHCKNGHEFTPENTAPISGHPDWRKCRQCAEDYLREWKRQRKAGQRVPGMPD